MRKQNFQAKKVLHFLIILFLLLALGFGIIFSSLETSRGLKLGAQYRGGYQAVVGVYDVNVKNDDENKTDLPNGDAKTGAGVLEAKLSPFADGSINVTIDGKFRLIVSAPRDSYSNNQQLFVNAIQSTGGLFVFTDKYEDVMLDSNLMGKAGLNGAIENKSPTSDLLGNVEQTSRQAGITNRPFLEFDLPGQAFSNMVAGDSNSGSEPPNLTMIVDTPTVLDTIRNYFLFADKDQLDNYLETFRTEVLKPLKEGIERGVNNPNEPNAISGDAATVLKDFFQIKYYKQADNPDNWTEAIDSLVNPNFINQYLDGNLDNFKALFFADQNPDRQFKYNNEVTKYIYDSNAKGTDFEANGRYYNPLKIDNKTTEIKVNQAFNYLTKNLFATCLLDKDQVNPENNPAGIKNKFNQSLFADYFIYQGAPTSGGSNGSLPNVNFGSINGSKFYIGTKNYTVAKKAAALISQTGSGLTFHVLSVAAVDAIITNTMFIVSLVALLIVIIAIALFILFFYRLLGLFTIIIAAIIASLTLLMSVVFGITIGPEIIAIMFVLMGIVMDISVVMFEAFKNNIYLEKRPLIASFNISNRETLGLVIDVILASLLPNIVLFWIGIGFLKNFATILTLGIFFVFLFGVVVLRLLIYFTARTSWLKKFPWMLPVDTSLNYDGRFINHYLLLLNQEKLDSYTGKTHLSSKQLIKIQKLEQRIQNLQTKDQVFIQKRQKQKQKRQLKLQKKWKKQLQILIQKRKNLDHHKRWSYFWVSHYNKKIDYFNYLVGDETTNGATAILNDQLTRVEKNTTKIGAITFAVTIFVTILALILTFTIGLNYSINYGQGTQFYVYGTYVSSTYDNTLAAPEGITELRNLLDNDPKKANQIIDDLKEIRQDSKTSVLRNHDLPPDAGNELTRPYTNEWQALGVYQAYRYLISHNYMQYISSRLAGINFKNATFMYGANYSKIDSTNSSYVDAPWVAIVTTNNLIPQNNAIKLALQTFAGQPSGATIPTDPNKDGGTLGMTLEPHTATTQIKQIGITFGIILLALLIYMLIRFKWTYYVALALGLGLTMMLTISLVVIFRIPFTIEALAGILGVISFASITGMLFLGRGKSIIASKDEKVLNQYFDQEIKLQAQKKQLKLQTKKKIQALKKTHHQQLKALDSKAENFKQQRRQLKKTQASELKQLRNQEKIALKKQFTEINAQIKLEARKNNFLKEIFANVLRFGLLRTVFLSSFYLIIGIITAITLPSIGVMGFILTVGVIASTLIMITIVLPIWIQLERRRIRLKYGYKKFVNNLQVTSEEQIIAGLND